MPDLRDLPSVDELLRSPVVSTYVKEYGHPLTREAIRAALDEARSYFRQTGQVADEARRLARISELLAEWTTPTLRPVINASGVIIHTNLGRAPLSHAALQAMQGVAAGYSTLEYDLAAGKRGSRTVHAEDLVRRLSGAQAALVVNNNAAAVLLVLTALAKRKRVIIARSQLVEIGGGFRVPDVMVQSGAKLVEVGTTNRVHRADYEDALQESAALVMRAHRSNFQILGFTAEPDLSELAEVAHRAGVYLVDDLGSGSLLDTAAFGMGHEPTVQESLAAGADLVCFSGDKLLGGPQAGIIAGRADLVAKLKKHPLARALRADKLCLAALAATLAHYLKDEALSQIPVWRMIAAQLETIRQRAVEWQKLLGVGQVIGGLSTVGGGSLPGETLPTVMLALTEHETGIKPNRLLALLRQANPPVVARVEADAVVFDPRTVLPEEEKDLLAAVRRSLSANPGV